MLDQPFLKWSKCKVLGNTTTNKVITNQTSTLHIQADLYLPAKVNGIFVFAGDEIITGFKDMVRSLIQDYQLGIVTFNTANDLKSRWNENQDVAVLPLMKFIKWFRKNPSYNQLGLSIWGIDKGSKAAIKAISLMGVEYIDALILQGKLHGFAGQLAYQLKCPTLHILNNASPHFMPIRESKSRLHSYLNYNHLYGAQSEKEKLKLLIQNTSNWFNAVLKNENAEMNVSFYN